ncbi:pirin family protein [Peredibacter starrii]|uniref:Pirin family protein n=1 Tax=Peredibacter starrii TaxID=28202 RepID=A0AAX4HRD4_9BACT|nr:pirin family protein [Peredibacter starrii]WPU65920.1 pirin family protein [Peredibacter starrii]
MKKLLFSRQQNERHWVGDGFPVRSIFSYHDGAKDISPFLMMDYAGPANFGPSTKRRGVGSHPHRGFETVTIVYSGEVEHRDSAGGGGIIRNGDVQWMTAASGLVHEEFHGPVYSKEGGPFEMVQLWVNLPKKDKMTKPRYQGIKNEHIPKLDLPDGAGTIRVIAGLYESAHGPAMTFTPINLWDLKLNANKSSTYTVPAGHTATLFVMEGEVQVESGEIIREAEFAVLDQKEATFTIKALKDSKVLFMGGEPINEPIAGYGPFVMNSPEEIHQAFSDFQQGKMGSMENIEGSEHGH